MSTQAAYFSEEAQPKAAEESKDAAAAAPSQADIDANKSEWGIKYDDECLKFEKEW